MKKTKPKKEKREEPLNEWIKIRITPTERLILSIASKNGYNCSSYIRSVINKLGRSLKKEGILKIEEQEDQEEESNIDIEELKKLSEELEKQRIQYNFLCSLLRVRNQWTEEQEKQFKDIGKLISKYPKDLKQWDEDQKRIYKVYKQVCKQIKNND